MTQCIRTRKHFSTPLEDILWNREQDRQSSYIAAQSAVVTLTDQVRAITAGYNFLRADNLCFFRADGTAVQCAMAVIGEDDAVIVLCNQETGSAVWTVQMRGTALYPAAAYIAAVQARVAANKAARH